jgi:hypothetical protein
MGNALTFPKICDRLNRRLLAQLRWDRLQKIQHLKDAQSVSILHTIIYETS